MERFNKKLALWVTKNVGTIWCAYIFAAIGVGSLVGVITNNTLLAIFCGAISSYFLQLVLLPIIMVGQNIQSEANDERMEKTLRHISKENERILTEVARMIKDVEKK